MVKSPEIDPSALETEIDIAPELQVQIVQLTARLDIEDHYSLLGVRPDADKLEIKRAYFELMNRYHSDRFYGKRTGSFGPRLLRIADVLTRAHDTLNRAKTRAEYDQYLESRRGTLGARLSFIPPASGSTGSSSPVVLAPPTGSIPPEDLTSVEQIYAQIPLAPKAPTIDLGTEDHEDFALPPHDEMVGIAAFDRESPTSPRSPAPPPSDAARRLLARKMGHRVKPPGSAVAATEEQVRTAVKANLKARYDARKVELEERVQRLLTKSELARQAGDWSAAVAGVRMATELRPDDPAIKIRLMAVQEEADRVLAPRFIEQAKYEEREGQFARAARSYERAARGKDSALLFNKSADCLLQLEVLNDVEKRLLVEMARSAVSRDQQKAAYRVNLARAYDIAGMKTSALGEVKRALELEPENQQAKSLHKMLK